MTESELQGALAAAQAWSSSFYRPGQMFGTNTERLLAQEAALAAERALAAARGQSYVEVIDLGVRWDTGAPVPRIVSDATRTVLLRRAIEVDPN